MLERMTELQCLILQDCFAIQTMTFVPDLPHLAQTLGSLILSNTEFPASEVRFLLFLKSLKVLVLQNCFKSNELDQDLRSQFDPTHLAFNRSKMPKLGMFVLNPALSHAYDLSEYARRYDIPLSLRSTVW
jgi:hypothetical protein